MRQGNFPVALEQIIQFFRATNVEVLTTAALGIEVQGACALDNPQPGCISFSSKVITPEHLSDLSRASLAALVTPANQIEHARADGNLPVIIATADPFRAFIALIRHLFPVILPDRQVSDKADVHPTARIGSRASIGAFCSIGAHAVIGDDAVLLPHVVVYPRAVIGEGCIIHAQAVVREDVRLGARCIVQAGAVIGSEGFGYIPDLRGKLEAVPQIGSVAFGCDVEIGANACVDRATFGSTSLGDGTKIDNLVQIGHNVTIGKHSILCGQSGIAGSSRIGNHVVLGAQSGIADHLEISDMVRVAAKAGVTRSLREKGDYAGFPARHIMEWRRESVALQRLVKNRSMTKYPRGNRKTKGPDAPAEKKGK